MSKPVETPKEDIRTRLTRVETRVEATLQHVAAKEGLAALRGEMSELRTELRGEMSARFAGQDRKIAAGFADQMKYTLGIMRAAIAGATTVILRAM